MTDEAYDEWEMAEGKANPEAMRRTGLTRENFRIDGRLDTDEYIWKGDNGGAMETFLGAWFNSLIPSEELIELNVGRGQHVRYPIGTNFHILRKEVVGSVCDLLDVTRETPGDSLQVETYGHPDWVDYITEKYGPQAGHIQPHPTISVQQAEVRNLKEGTLTISNPTQVTLDALGVAGTAAFIASAHPGADADGAGAWGGAGGLTPETEAVWAEYSRAKAKHGNYVIDGPFYSDPQRMVVLMEEVGEAAHEMTYDVASEGAHRRLYAELIQVGTMALGFAKAVRERGNL